MLLIVDLVLSVTSVEVAIEAVVGRRNVKVEGTLSSEWLIYIDLRVTRQCAQALWHCVTVALCRCVFVSLCSRIRQSRPLRPLMRFNGTQILYVIQGAIEVTL